MRPLPAFASLLLPFALATGLAVPAQAAEPDARQFQIMTVHLDGITGLQAAGGHPAEAFPTAPLPAGGGLVLRQPDAEGSWSIRAYVFQPAQIVVREGDRVSLTFVDVQGPRFAVQVDGQAPLALRRGESRTVTFVADKPGIIGYSAPDHQPTMRGEVVVLPR